MKCNSLTFRGLARTVFLMMISGFFVLTAHADTLPNGLKLLSFDVETVSPPLVGTTAYVEMTLKNISGAPIKFSK